MQAASQVQGVSLQDSRDAFMDSSAQLKKSQAGNSDISEIRESRTKFRALVNPQQAKASPIIEDI